MAYVNVAEWSPEHVAEWLKGLEYSLLPYVHFFLNNKIDGSHLLNLTADDLEDLHIFKVGHQQLILEAVELLRQLHYNLTSETLQSLAVKLGCRARSLYNDLKLNGPQDHTQHIRQERVSMSVLSAVSEVLTSVKALVSWLDRLPFHREPSCIKLKKTVLKLSIELASTTQRDQFAERPHSLIKRNSLHLADLCDKFIQDSKDSLILQPASLDIAMIKKKPDEELGIHIKSTYSGVHIIGGIKDQSPAKRCNKIEKGDEIIQVNYQTVIGWQQKKLVTAMTEHSSELHLTIKKRPRHINILGEVIVLRPYRIPSKKTANKCHKWSEDNQLRGQDTCSTSNESECLRDDFNEDDDDSAFLPADASNHVLLAKEMPTHRHLLSGTSPAAVQRRATVSGASPTVSKPPVNIEDLVNGVSHIKNETFSRSISHDSACHKLSVKPDDTSLNVKPDNPSETLTIYKKIHRNEETHEISNKLSSLNPSSETYIHSENFKDVKSEVSAIEILPVQEEDTLLENKSLTKSDSPKIIHNKAVNDECVKSYVSAGNEIQAIDSISSCSKSSASSTAAQSNNNSTNKNNIVLYNWEGADTAFCGRRPSAHDISNEIAGSKTTDINPVFLWKASKLPNSPPEQDASRKDSEEMSSYQIVIVGGVPQRCPPSIKEGKEKSFPYRKKENASKLASRRISCKDLGKGDCEGYLYKQKEGKGFFPSSHQWVKRWIILKNLFLYIYKDSNDSKAECLISLPGSHVSRAFECKTKKYAFKVTQQHAKFYFATKSQEDGVKWLNKMGLAAIAYDASADVTTSGFAKPTILDNFYSETDDSESESPITSRRAEHAIEMSTSSSSSEFSCDHYVKREKNIYTSNPKHLSLSGYPKVKKSYHNNKDLIPNWIKRKTQNNAETRQTIINTPGLISPEAYLSSKSNFVETPGRKVSYNRSFSYTDTSYCHFKTDPKTLMRKMSYEFSAENQVISPHSITNKTKQPSQVWNSVDEEYDMLTSSLGRQQKPLAKEITPGLVARMAVSYSNLTQKNTLVSANQVKKVNPCKGIPAPGYVAKISDSFDHLAKTHSSNAFTGLDNKGKKLQHATSSIGQTANEIKHPSCKRSASETQVSKKMADVSSRIESLKNTFSPESQTTEVKREKKEHSERYVSLLDKEYNRVFEGKKVTQYQLKSYNRDNFKHSDCSKREMRFFPNYDISEVSSVYNFSKSNSIHVGKDASKMSSEISRNSSLKTWCDASEKYQQFPSELKKAQSFDLHNSNKSSSPSCGAHLYYSHLDSSEGIENIGFSCVDQLSNDSFDSNISNSSKDIELGQRHQYCATLSSTPAIQHNLAVPGDTSDGGSSKGTFRFFNSPKFMKKLTSPKLDKKNIFKSKKQAREKKAEQKEIANIQNDKKFFGSPRLVRAIFGSPKNQKKVTVSSAVQTDKISLHELSSQPNKPAHDLNRNDSFVTTSDFPDNISSYMECHEHETAISKSSSNSSLNSNISNSLSPFTNSMYYVEARIKPQITISLPLVTDKENETRTSPPETPRTPLKPTMGVAMLSKKRLPSVSGESSVSISSSKSSHDGSVKEAVPLRTEVSMDINGDNKLLEALESLQKVDISSDTSDLSTYRSKANSSPGI